VAEADQFGPKIIGHLSLCATFINGVFTRSSKCIQNTRANAGRLLDRVNTL